MRWLVAVLVLTACYREKYDAALATRLAHIEQRLDALEKAVVEVRTRADTTELSALAERLSDLQQSLAQLSSQIPAPPPKKREPDKAATYAVPLGTSPALGSPKAKVTMVMALEFDCPYCRRAWDTVDELRKKYGTELRVVYKSYVVHPKTATYPAQAACAAARQGKWRPFADLVWAKAFDVKSVDSEAFAPAHIDALAKQAKLDMTKYRADVAGPCPGEVKDDMAMLVKLAVSATPSFFINGRFMAGARPLEEFTKLIDEELAKASKAGVPPERYYDEQILGKGLTEVAAP